MKLIVAYQLAALVAGSMAAPSPEPENFPAPSPRDVPVVADLYTGEPKDRDLYDASGLHKRADLDRLYGRLEPEASSGAALPHLGDRSVSKRNGWLHCGNMADGDRFDALDQQNQIKGEGDYIIPARRCLRVKCWNTTGLYVCNDQGVDLHVSGAAIWQRANIIHESCCYMGGYNAFASGQQFTDSQGGYNVIQGYSNCNHDKYQAPDTYAGSSKCAKNNWWIT